MVDQRDTSDTSNEVMKRQFEVWRAMSPGERAMLADQLSDDITQFAIAGIRAQFPHASETEVRNELIRRRYGDAFLRQFVSQRNG